MGFTSDKGRLLFCLCNRVAFCCFAIATRVVQTVSALHATIAQNGTRLVIELHFVALQSQPARCKLCLHFTRLLLKMLFDLLIDLHFVASQSHPAWYKLRLHFTRLLLKMLFDLLIDQHFVASQPHPAWCKLRLHFTRLLLKMLLD